MNYLEYLRNKLGEIVYLSVSKRANPEVATLMKYVLDKANIKTFQWDSNKKDIPYENYTSALFIPPADEPFFVGKGQNDEFEELESREVTCYFALISESVPEVLQIGTIGELRNSTFQKFARISLVGESKKFEFGSMKFKELALYFSSPQKTEYIPTSSEKRMLLLLV